MENKVFKGKIYLKGKIIFLKTILIFSIEIQLKEKKVYAHNNI